MYVRTLDWSHRVEMHVWTSWINWWTCWLSFSPALTHLSSCRHGSAGSLGDTTRVATFQWWSNTVLLRPRLDLAMLSWWICTNWSSEPAWLSKQHQRCTSTFGYRRSIPKVSHPASLFSLQSLCDTIRVRVSVLLGLELGAIWNFRKSGTFGISDHNKGLFHWR